MKFQVDISLGNNWVLVNNIHLDDFDFKCEIMKLVPFMKTFGCKKCGSIFTRDSLLVDKNRNFACPSCHKIYKISKEESEGIKFIENFGHFIPKGNA